MSMAELDPEYRIHIYENMKGSNGCLVLLLLFALGLPLATLFDKCVDTLTQTVEQTDPAPTPHAQEKK